MSYSTTQTDTVFERIWQNLTTDHLMRLLDPLRPRPHGRYVTFACPGCGRPEAWIYEPKDGKGPRLHCNRANNCGYVKSLWEYVLETSGGDKRSALAQLAAVVNVPLSETPAPKLSARERGRNQAKRAFALPAPPPVVLDAAPKRDALQADCAASLPGSPVAVDYLSRRGLSLQDAQAMGFGFADQGSPNGLAGRVTHPLIDERGVVVCVEGRTLADGAKYWAVGPKSSAVFVPSGTLTFCDGLHVVEGVYDAAAMHLLGLPVVALSGTAARLWLIHRMAGKTLIIAFDADEAGDEAAANWTALCRPELVATRRIRPADGNDWGDILPHGLPALRQAYWQATGCPAPLFESAQQRLDYLRSHEASPGKTRAECLALLETQINELAALCDIRNGETPTGYTDPLSVDPFSDFALLSLRENFSSLLS